jgi:hypothetical protein
MSSDITSLRALARAEAEIADEASGVLGLAEAIIAAGKHNGLDVAQMMAGREDLEEVARIWSAAAAAHQAAANAATDLDEANAGRVGRDLSWAAGE